MNYRSTDSETKGIYEDRSSDIKETLKFRGLKTQQGRAKQKAESCEKIGRNSKTIVPLPISNIETEDPSLPSFRKNMLEQFKRVVRHRRNCIRSGGRGSRSMPSSRRRRCLPIFCRITPLHSSVRDAGLAEIKTKPESAPDERHLIIHL